MRQFFIAIILFCSISTFANFPYAKLYEISPANTLNLNLFNSFFIAINDNFDRIYDDFELFWDSTTYTYFSMSDASLLARTTGYTATGNVGANAGVLFDGIDISTHNHPQYLTTSSAPVTYSQINHIQALTAIENVSILARTTGYTTTGDINAASGVFISSQTKWLNQDIRTTASPTFQEVTLKTVTLSTVVALVNQDVRTTASPVFYKVNVSSQLAVNTTYTTQTLEVGGAISLTANAVPGTGVIPALTMDYNVGNSRFYSQGKNAATSGTFTFYTIEGDGQNVTTALSIGADGSVTGTYGISAATITATSLSTGSIVMAGVNGLLTQDNSNLYWNDTSNNLGIGTKSPISKLDIWQTGTGGNSGFVIHSSTGVLCGDYSCTNSGTAFGFVTMYSGATLPYGSGQIGAYLTASGNSYFTGGNVGIGTASPGVALDISHTNSGTGSLFITTGLGINQYTDSEIVLRRSRNTPASPAIVQNGDELGSIYFKGYDGTNGYQNAALINGFVDGTPGASDMPGGIYFHTVPDGSTTLATRMTIRNDGKVGISTAAPITTLSIAGICTADQYNTYSEAFDGDALSDILKVKTITKNEAWGELDHKALPDKLRDTVKGHIVGYRDKKTGKTYNTTSSTTTGGKPSTGNFEEIKQDVDLFNMSGAVMMLIRGLQQTCEENNKLKARIEVLERR